MSNSEFVDIIVEDMRLDDPELKTFDGKGGAKLPPGTYTFECFAIKRDKSKKGNPMLVVDWRVVSSGEYEGETIKQFLTLDPDQPVSRARLKNVVEAAGVPVMDNGAFSTGSFIGRRVEAEVEHEQQEGSFDPVRNVNVPGKTFAKLVSERPAEQPKQTAPAQNTSRRPVGNANGARQQSR